MLGFVKVRTYFAIYLSTVRKTGPDYRIKGARAPLTFASPQLQARRPPPESSGGVGARRKGFGNQRALRRGNDSAPSSVEGSSSLDAPALCPSRKVSAATEGPSDEGVRTLRRVPRPRRVSPGSGGGGRSATPREAAGLTQRDLAATLPRACRRARWRLPASRPAARAPRSRPSTRPAAALDMTITVNLARAH